VKVTNIIFSPQSILKGRTFKICPIGNVVSWFLMYIANLESVWLCCRHRKDYCRVIHQCHVRKYVLCMHNQKLRHIRPSGAFWPEVTKSRDRMWPWWNGPWMAPFQNCVRWSRLPTKMATKLNIEKRGDEILIGHCCFSVSQNELKF
jgi:hypothetical protein